MCGRYAASADIDELVEEFEIVEVLEPQPSPSWNIAPTDPVPAVVERPARDSPAVLRRLVALRWGLVPSWATDPRSGARMINARFETVATKPAFRKPFAARRCLLPADGYYEWYAKSAGKQPFFIHRVDGRRLAMAGIYEFWRDPNVAAGEPGAWISSCAIITTTATDALGQVHDRMPMIVQREAWDAWLDPGRTDPHEALELLRVTDAEHLQAYAVGPEVGNVRNDGPGLIAPVEET